MVAIGKLRDLGASAIIKIVTSGELCGACQTEMPLHIKQQPKPLTKRAEDYCFESTPLDNRIEKQKKLKF